MATQSFQRQLQQTNAPFNATITTGFLYEASNKFYIPFTFDNFSAPDLTVTVNAVAGATKLVAVTPGALDEIRVGDVVNSLSSGTLTTKATFTRSCYCPRGQSYVIYPHTFTSSTLTVQAGDVVTSATANVVPSSTVVDKIDYATRRIFLSNPIGTAGDVTDTLTFAPPIRVTAVRLSTAATNPNEIDIDSTVGTGANGVIATIKNGAREAVSHIFRVEPLNSTASGKAEYSVGVAMMTGKEVKGSANGLNNIDATTVGYVNLGVASFDGDVFLTNARLPRPTSVTP